MDPTESPPGNGSHAIGGPEGEQLLAVTYEIVLPIIATLGLFGHVCSLVVLSRTKFHGFIFTYLKAMAVVDALYLLYCMQVVRVQHVRSQQLFSLFLRLKPPLNSDASGSGAV